MDHLILEVGLALALIAVAVSVAAKLRFSNVPLLNTEYPDAVNMRRLGARAVLAVPLIHQRTAYGAILLFRREPRPFSGSGRCCASRG